ncbi:MAG: hypothetical protein P0Y63_01675 [Klebsiella huaxiensis]|uniref:hypothetical protein n=1 Tax=Klebsiella huaxiensis TaxID=2153354 RepID=UPI0026ECE478|nr:hypothetical protein [Klebsiella huaxiensis]WEJ89773.1 MAG: hypothetical protein P0Y63_01675 [Klebsiella huaxiensis]
MTPSKTWELRFITKLVLKIALKPGARNFLLMATSPGVVILDRLSIFKINSISPWLMDLLSGILISRRWRDTLFYQRGVYNISKKIVSLSSFTH